MQKFRDLLPSHTAPPYWKEQRENVARITASLTSEPIVAGILSSMQAAFDAGEPLPDGEQLSIAVPELEKALRTLHEASPYNEQSVSGIVQRLTTSALARFLATGSTDVKRLAAATQLENAVDWTYLSECFARELDAPEKWMAQTLGRTLTLKAEGSDDDRDLLQNELLKWSAERRKHVPRWRPGNLMPMGLRDWLLMGELLRAVDEVAWLRFLDKQDLASAVETLLWQAQLDQVPACVLRLIAESDVAFDANRNRTASVTVYFIVEKALELIENDLGLRVHRGAVTEDAKAELAAQDGLLQELVDTLAARADSEVLLTELGADYLLRAQAAIPEFGRMQTRFQIYQRFVATICTKLGSVETVVALARVQGAEPRETRWGLWLLAADRACSAEAISRGSELTLIRQELWTWLTELMVSGDSSLINRYSDFPEWVVQLAGYNLVKVNAPTAQLESTWRALTAQRMERVENRYAKDTWRTSKLACRSGFLAARVAATWDASLAEQLWSLSAQMAISSLLSSANGDQLAELEYGLCHLAAGNLLASGEPARTLAYLKGEPDLMSRAVIALRTNGGDAGNILRAASKGGIDVICHLELASNGDQINNFEAKREDFRKAAAENGTGPS